MHKKNHSNMSWYPLLTKFLMPHFFYLLDCVTRRSEKLGFVKKKKVLRHIGDKCLFRPHPCIPDLSKYNNIIRIWISMMKSWKIWKNNLQMLFNIRELWQQELYFTKSIFFRSPIWKISVGGNVIQQIKKCGPVGKDWKYIQHRLIWKKMCENFIRITQWL